MASTACAHETTKTSWLNRGLPTRKWHEGVVLNGNLDNLSSDLLIRLLAALGYRVKVSVSRVDSAA